jgi:hypothetical protein
MELDVIVEQVDFLSHTYNNPDTITFAFPSTTKPLPIP